MYKIIIFFWIYKFLEVKNSKINISIGKDNKYVEVKLLTENDEFYKLKLKNEGKTYIKKNSGDNFPDSKNIICEKGYKPKKANFKFYEYQENFYELDFCVVVNDYQSTNNSNDYNENIIKNEINFETIKDLLKKNLKKFDLKYDIDYSKFLFSGKLGYFEPIQDYYSLKLTINPKIPKKEYLFDSSLILNIKDNKNLQINNLKFDKKNIIFSTDIFNTYDFIISSPNNNLIELNNILDNKNDLKGYLEIKNDPNSKLKNFKYYDIKLKNIFEYKNKKTIRKNIIFKKDKLLLLNIGFNYIRENINLIVTYEEGKDEIIKAYKKTFSKTGFIIILIIFGIIFLISIYFIFFKLLRKKKRKNIIDFDIENDSNYSKKF